MGPRILWAPQAGPQTALISCPFPLIGFGGARGGGKSDGVLGKYAIKSERYGNKFNAILFRRELPQADDLIDRAREIYLGLGAEWHEQKKQFVFEGGGRLRFRPLENVADAEKYQGQNVTDAGIEEAGNYPDPAPIDRLFGALRSKHRVPTQMILTFNPGGRGHHWLKERFIKPAPHGMKTLHRELGEGRRFEYIFIPSRVWDNKILLENDPGYIDRLHMVGTPELVRAWLEGDFEIHEGAYFPELGARHLVAPFPIPRHWPKYVGFDWGYNSPWFAVWGAVSSGKTDGGVEVPYPKGSIVIYREATGRQMENAEIAKRIKELQEGEEITQSVADPSIFAHEGGPSIADQFRGAGIAWREADNERIGGWSQIRQRAFPNPAMLYISTACPFLWESITALPIDPKHPEDADTTANDHAADALRYLCKARVLESDYVYREESVRMKHVKVAKYIEERRRERDRARI